MVPSRRRRRVRVFVVPGAAPEAQDAIVKGLADAGHAVLNDPRAAPPTPGLAQAERQDFLLAVDRMLEADVVVADASEDRAAVGWCVAWFLAKGRLAVVACRRDRRAALPPMLAGNPSPWQRLVLYDGPDDLAKGLLGLLGR